MGRGPARGARSEVPLLETDLRRRALRVCLALASLSLVHAGVLAVGAARAQPVPGDLGVLVALVLAGGLVELSCALLALRHRHRAGMALLAGSVVVELLALTLLAPSQVLTVVLASLVPVVVGLQFLSRRAAAITSTCALAVALLAMALHAVPAQRPPLDPATAWIDLAGGALALAGLTTVVAQTRGAILTRTRLLLEARAAAAQRRARLDLAAQQQRLTSEFVQLVSHELRTPLSSIMGYAELLHDAEDEIEAAERQQMLTVVTANARRLDGLVGDLLDVARLDAGQLRLTCRAVDACAVLEGVADVVRPLLDGKQQTLEIQAPRPVRLTADPQRLEQVLVNLVTNAHKYSPTGSRVRVSVTDEGDDAVFTVRDEGVGMDAEELSRLFTKFFRSERAQAQATGGTGLGLVLTGYLVELHGGSVGVHSEPGLGSTFTVRLPRDRRPAALTG